VLSARVSLEEDCGLGRVVFEDVLKEIYKGPRCWALARGDQLAASLPPELHDNEGLYKKLKRFGIE
jgi:hypothetical protein